MSLPSIKITIEAYGKTTVIETTEAVIMFDDEKEKKVGCLIMATPAFVINAETNDIMMQGLAAGIGERMFNDPEVKNLFNQIFGI